MKGKKKMFTFVNPSPEEKSLIVNEAGLRNTKIRAMNEGMLEVDPSMTYKNRVETLSNHFCVSKIAVKKALGELKVIK